MAVANQLDGRKIMQLSQAARFMTAMVTMVTKSVTEHDKEMKLKENNKLVDAIFKGETPDISKIEDLLSHSKIRIDDKGIHFNNNVSVRLLKNYVPGELSMAMAEHNVSAIRIVENGSGLTAVLYSSLDEDKMAAALKSVEVSLGSSPVVDDETIQKMCSSRPNSTLFEFKDMSLADVMRFQYAASKQGFVINISESRTNDVKGTQNFNIKVISSDKKKIDKALRDIAVYKIKDGADSFDRGYAQLIKTLDKAAEKVMNGETFYICSPTRRDSYIEVGKNGFKVMSQQGNVPKEVKAVEGALTAPQKFNQLGNELFSFECPVILSAQEFTLDADERLSTVVAEAETLHQQNEGDAFVRNVASTVLNAANACGYEIYNASNITSTRFQELIEKSNLPNKDEVVLAIGQLNALPKEMVEPIISEYHEHISELDSALEEASLVEGELEVNENFNTRENIEEIAKPTSEERG